MFKNTNLICAKVQSNLKTIHSANILNKLKEYGLNLKLSTNHADQSSVFCLGLTAKFSKVRKDKLMYNLMANHPEQKIMNISVLPLKKSGQILTSIKICHAGNG